jgi:integrase/recombinase XerD
LDPSARLWPGPGRRRSARLPIDDVDLDACRIRVTQGKGAKDRYVPFPESFKEALALHIDVPRAKGAVYLFESSWKKAYTDRGVRRSLTWYTHAAGLTASISPHKLRHFLFTWLKTHGIEDALIQPYSGQGSRQSLADAQKEHKGSSSGSPSERWRLVTASLPALPAPRGG